MDEMTELIELDKVGPARAEALAAEGFETIGDVQGVHANRLLPAVGQVMAARIKKAAEEAPGGRR